MKKLLLARAAKLVVCLAMVPGIAVATPAPIATAQQGYADRVAWENWFNGLDAGRYHDGAAFWAEHRSDRPQPSCEWTRGGDDSFYRGCLMARLRLAPMDRLRLSSPQYRQGWNTYPDAPPVVQAAPSAVPAAALAPVAPPPAPAGGPVSADLLASMQASPVSKSDEQAVEPPAPALPEVTVNAPAPTKAGNSEAESFLRQMTPVGQNGAWRILAYQSALGRSCFMATQTVDHRVTLLIGVPSTKFGDAKPAAIIYTEQPSPERQMLVSVTDNGSGETLLMKSVHQEDGVLFTDLDFSDTTRLWDIGMAKMMDLDGGKQLVNVHAGSVSFDLDIHGAMEAWQNTQSCAKE
jgi:hypothetical protein